VNNNYLEHLSEWNNYILDVALLNSGEMIVVELNPFNEYEGNGTSPCLYDWVSDDGIICNDKDFDYRVRTEYVDFTLTMSPNAPIRNRVEALAQLFVQ
jgi:hypothetical protein